MNAETPKSSSPGPLRSRIPRRVFPLLIALTGVLMVGVLLLIPSGKEPPPSAATLPVNVEVELVEVIPSLADTFELHGIVEPNRVVSIAAEVAGRVEHIDCIEGQSCRKGDRLIRLNAELLQAEFDRTKAQAEFERREYERMVEAGSRGVATPNELDQARMRAETSRAAFNAAKINLDRASIVLPISGTVNSLPVELGEYVQPGDVVAEIVDNKTVKVVFDVPERDISYLNVGEEQEIFSRLSETVDLTGRISYISELADPLSHTTKVEISVPNEDRRLRSGQIVTVRLKRREMKELIMIPLDAVIPLESGYMVYVVQDGKAQPRKGLKIDIRSIRGKRVRVTSGLVGGEKLIVKGNRLCGPGQTVNETRPRKSLRTTTGQKRQEK